MASEPPIRSGPPDPSAYTPPQSAPAAAEGDATGGIIPYKNPPALIAYYLGIFSFIPIFGLFLAIPAFILGLKGLKKRRENPAVKGSVHAWIGIIMGGFFTLAWTALIGLILFGILANL